MDQLNPSVDWILGKLTEATALEFTLAGNLKNHRPQLGLIQWQDKRAYFFLELLADRQLDQGRWERTKKGYHLRGVSLASREKDAVTAVTAKKASHAPGDLILVHPLAADIKLHSRLSLVKAQPTLSEILEKLQQATGLAYSLAENLRNHSPNFGMVQWTDVPAFSILEILANAELKDGGWRKVEDGYFLFGHSLAPNKPDGGKSWLWVILGSLGFSGAYLWLRRNAKQKGQP